MKMWHCCMISTHRCWWKTWVEWWLAVRGYTYLSHQETKKQNLKNPASQLDKMVNASSCYLGQWVKGRSDWPAQTKWHQNQIHNGPLYVCMGRIHLIHSCPASGRHLFVLVHTSSMPVRAARSDTTKSVLIKMHWCMQIWWHFWGLTPGPLLWQASSRGGNTLSFSLFAEKAHFFSYS